MMDNEIDFYIDTECENINDFDCDFEVFNIYLKKHIPMDKAVFHYIINPEDDSLIAYFSLLASCIFLNDSSSNSNIIPAIEVKMFAIDKKYRKLNLSHRLLADIYDIVMSYLRYVGAEALILYSVPAEKVVQMYENNGFKKMLENFSMYKSNFNDGCVPMYRFIE